LHRDWNYLPAKAMSEGFGSLQTLKAPAPELPLTRMLKSAAALGVVAVAMPCMDGIKRASEATVGGCNLDDE